MLRKGEEIIAGYKLEAFLGRGQFGQVWRTTAPGGTSAALKFIDLRGSAGKKEFRGIQRVKRIAHANLMPVTAIWMLDDRGRILDDDVIDRFGESREGVADSRRDLQTLAPPVDPGPDGADRREGDGVPSCLVVGMLLGTQNLEDRLEACRQEGHSGIPIDELLGYMEDAAKGIDFLNRPQHDLGEGPVAIQHCDIKPANLMLVGDSVVVCDFGLARFLSDSATATASVMSGTPAYIAPEAIASKPARTTDQYSLAVTYAHLRTGALPLVADSPAAALDAHLRGTLDFGALPPAERSVIQRATARNPERRYPTAVEMVQALRFAATGKESPANGRYLKFGLAAGVLALAAWSLWALMAGRSPAPVAPPPRAQTYVLRIVPAEVLVEIDGRPHSVDADGRLEVSVRPGQEIRLQITPEATSYEPVARTLSANELAGGMFTITLDWSASYYAESALEQFDKDFAGAVEQYREAIRRDRRLGNPQPHQVLSGNGEGEPRIAIDPLSQRLLSAGEDATVRLWTLPSAEGLAAEHIVLEHHTEVIDCVALGGNGRWAVTGGWDNDLAVWDLEIDPPALHRVFRHEDDVVSLTVQQGWVATGSLDGSVSLWEVAAEDGRLLAADAGARIRVNPAGGATIRQVAATSSRSAVLWLDNHGGIFRWEWASGNGRPRELVPESRESKVFVVLPMAGQPAERLVAGSAKGSVSIWNVGKGDMPSGVSWKELDGHLDQVDALAVNRQGTRLASGAADGSVRTWDLADLAGGSNRRRAHRNAVSSVAVSPSGQWVVSGGLDGVAVLWSAARPDWRPQGLPLTLPEAQIRVVEFSPDERWIVAATSRGKILVWDTRRVALIYYATTGVPFSEGARVALR